MNQELLDSVFHSYDIRGLVGTQLNEDFYYNLSKAFVTFLKAKNIAVGYDIRPESEIFAENFARGAQDLGCNVKFIGEIATEMLYFAVGSDPTSDGGIVVTASHNSAEWNGCKMVAKDVKAISKVWGMDEIKTILKNETYSKPSETKGELEKLDIFPDYKAKILSFIDDAKIRPMNIVVDAGNGIGGKVFEYVFGELPLQITKLFFEPDGDFPNHAPNPTEEENVAELEKTVISQNADLGIALDGDSDRVYFIDSKGRHPNGIFTGSILARYFCKQEQNAGRQAKIVHDPRLTWPIEKEVIKDGGIPMISKAGRSYLKEKMRTENAVFGIELSSHFYYRDFYHSDSSMVTIVRMLILLSEGLDFSKELDYLYSTYIVSGEVNYRVEDQDGVIQKIKEFYKDGELNEIDGISIEFPDWRFNLRKSNTERLLRLNIEATSEAFLKEKFNEIESLIGVKRENQPALKSLFS